MSIENGAESRTQRFRLRDDAPNDLAYAFDIPGAGLIRISAPRDHAGILSYAEFQEAYCTPEPTPATTDRIWPERPARAGSNPVLWNDMSVIWRDTPPPEVEDGDRLETPDGTFERRNGEWVRR